MYENILEFPGVSGGGGGGCKTKNLLEFPGVRGWGLQNKKNLPWGSMDIVWYCTLYIV